MILLNGYILTEALTIAPTTGDAAEMKLFKRFCPAKYDETSPEYKKRQELLKADPGAKAPVQSYKYGDTVVKWYRAAKAANKADQIDELTNGIEGVEQTLKDYERVVDELKRGGKMPEKVDVNGRPTPAGDPTRLRMLSGFKLVYQKLKELADANKKFLDPMEPNDLDRKNIRLCFVEDGIAVWKTKYFKTTNKFVHQMWGRSQEEIARDAYCNPEIDSPYCTRVSENWKTYSRHDPNYCQFWFFKVVPGVDYVPGDLDNPGTYETFKKLFKTGPNILMLTGSNGDMNDRRSNDFYDAEEIIEPQDDVDFGGKDQKLYDIFKKHFSVDSMNVEEKQWWESKLDYNYRKTIHHVRWNDDASEKKYVIDDDVWHGNITLDSNAVFKLINSKGRLPKKIDGGIVFSDITISDKFRLDLIPEARAFEFIKCVIAGELNFNIKEKPAYWFTDCEIYSSTVIKSFNGEIGSIGFEECRHAGAPFIASKDNIFSNVKTIKTFYSSDRRYNRTYVIKIDLKDIDIEELRINSIGDLGGDLSKLTFKKVAVSQTYDLDASVKKIGFPRVTGELELTIGSEYYGNECNLANIINNNTDDNCAVILSIVGYIQPNFLNGCRYRKLIIDDGSFDKGLIVNTVAGIYNRHENFDENGLFQLNDENKKNLNRFENLRDRTFKIYLNNTETYIYYIDSGNKVEFVNRDGTPFNGTNDTIKSLETNFDIAACGGYVISRFIESGIFDKIKNVENVTFNVFEDSSNMFTNNSAVIIGAHIKKLSISGGVQEFNFMNCDFKELNIKCYDNDKNTEYSFQNCNIEKFFPPPEYIKSCTIDVRGGGMTVCEYNYSTVDYNFYIKKSQVKLAYGSVPREQNIFKRIEDSSVEVLACDYEGKPTPFITNIIFGSSAYIVNSVLKANTVTCMLPATAVHSSVSNSKFDCQTFEFEQARKSKRIDEQGQKYAKSVIECIPADQQAMKFTGRVAGCTKYIKPGTHVGHLLCDAYKEDVGADWVSFQNGVKVDKMCVWCMDDVDIAELFKNYNYDIPFKFYDHADDNPPAEFLRRFERRGNLWYLKKTGRAVSESLISEWRRILNKIR